jgi:protein-tyrosine phosphatase
MIRAVPETRVLRVDPEKFDPAALAPAVDALRDGGLVGLPTETVYGIAVNLGKPDAVRRALELRSSPPGTELTVHLGDRDELRRVVPGPVPAAAARLIQRFWPGPLTILFPAPGGKLTGVRYPNHKVAREVIRRAGVRAGAPSARRGPEAPLHTGADVVRVFGGALDVIVDAGPTRQKGVSTVVRVEGPRVAVVREGAIPRSMIEEANLATILFVCTGNTCRSPMAEAIYRKLLADRLGAKEGDLAARGYRVISAGTAAGHGGAATEEAEQAVRKYGADLSAHSSQPVSVAMVEEADRVYVMTARHRKVLIEWMPEHAGKIQLLDPSGKDVEDPVGAPASVYRECARVIHAAIVERLKEAP